MKSNIYKKHDRDTTANDLNPGCRRIIANTKARRNLADGSFKSIKPVL